MTSLRGKILISSGALYDPNFRHTVVLVGEHTVDGALGVILNRPLKVTVDQAVPALGAFAGGGAVLYQGGPVQPESPVMLAEFEDVSGADLHVFGSVGFLVGDVSDPIEGRVRRARVYAGYSGWASGQLEEEIAEDSWIVDAARTDDVFTETPELLWSHALRRMGPAYERLSRMPFDPSMN